MINSEQKISKIESLTNESVLDLVSNMLLKTGYSDIKREGGHLLANNNGPISTESHGFIFFHEKMSGNIG